MVLVDVLVTVVVVVEDAVVVEIATVVVVSVAVVLDTVVEVPVAVVLDTVVEVTVAVVDVPDVVVVGVMEVVVVGRTKNPSAHASQADPAVFSLQSKHSPFSLHAAPRPLQRQTSH
jgi:hypothetical protein